MTRQALTSVPHIGGPRMYISLIKKRRARGPPFYFDANTGLSYLNFTRAVRPKVRGAPKYEVMVLYWNGESKATA
jgi:hypothetical protein